MADPMLKASLVWDGSEAVGVPEEMGTPTPNQLQGTVYEKVAELGCRVCYDSLGHGRSSNGLHQHILQVGHLSVYEHAVFTVFVDGNDITHASDILALANRPGLYLRPGSRCGKQGLYLTLNPRVVLDWSKHSNEAYYTEESGMWESILSYHASVHLPQVVGYTHHEWVDFKGVMDRSEVVEPETDDEKWITLFLSCSRGCSHELVRHGDFTAISQRSTRYVDESTSQWICHPLLEDYLGWRDGVHQTCIADVVEKQRLRILAQAEANNKPDKNGVHTLVFAPELFNPYNADPYWPTVRDIELRMHDCSNLYDKLVGQLEKYAMEIKGVKSKTHARKQARGAARGYLGNGLITELIFSASVAQWKHILKMRMSDAADGEIRLLANFILDKLLTSRYSESFKGLATKPAEDGIGLVLA